MIRMDADSEVAGRRSSAMSPMSRGGPVWRCRSGRRSNSTAVLTIAIVGRAGELPAGEKSEMRRRSTAADAYAEVG